MSHPKVLVFSPTYEGKDYIFKEFYERISSLDYPNYDFMIIDNTEDDTYFNRLVEQGYENIYRVSRGGNSRQALCNAQNFARKRAIDEGYDYVLSVESDLIPPKDIIIRLLRHFVPVVGVVYMLGVEDIKVPCLFVLTPKNGVIGTRLVQPHEIPLYRNAGLKRIHGVGMGCTLIRRDVFSKYFFWYDERFTNKHSDVYFFLELENDKVPVYVDTDVFVEHYPSSWDLVKDR